MTGRWGIFTPAATILQVSITEPPPRATMQSAPHASACWRPASIVAMEGSEWMSSNTVQPTPAASSEATTGCSKPSAWSVRSVTSSTCL